MFSNTKKRVVTLNIEPNEARLLVTEGKQIVYWGGTPLADGLIRHGIIDDPSRVSAIIDSLFGEAELPRDNVIVSITGLRSISRILSLPKIKPKLLKEAILNEAEREMPVPLDELYLSWELVGTGNAQNHYCVLGVPRDLVDTEAQTLLRAGIRPRALNLKPLALAKAVNRSDALIIDIEPDSFDLVALVGSVPVVMRTIMSRGDTMTVEDRIQQLSEELSRTIQYYNSSHPENMLADTAPAFLTGSLAIDPDISEPIEALLDNPVEPLNPPLDYPTDLPLSLAQYAVNIGLAVGRPSSLAIGSVSSSRSTVVNPNILPKEYGPEPLKLSSILYPALASFLVIFLLIMMTVKFGADGKINGMQAELNDINEQISELNELTSPITDTIASMEAEESRLTQENAYYQAAPESSDMTESLDAIIDELTYGIELTSITETDARIDIVGTAINVSKVASYATALEETGLFTTVYVPSMSTEDDTTVSFNIKCDR